MSLSRHGTCTLPLDSPVYFADRVAPYRPHHTPRIGDPPITRQPARPSHEAAHTRAIDPASARRGRIVRRAIGASARAPARQPARATLVATDGTPGRVVRNGVSRRFAAANRGSRRGEGPLPSQARATPSLPQFPRPRNPSTARASGQPCRRPRAPA